MSAATTSVAALADRKAVRDLARSISTVENRGPGYEAILARAYRAPVAARVVGVTGPPGAGKSTLVDALTAHWAGAGDRVAVLAVDPSSPYSGGAVLGDRVRLERSADLPGVYFRSVAARGDDGGLSAAVCDILAVLNEASFGRVLVETVGAGQADLAIAAAADCVVVVGVPGLGDAVQAAKAGLMEIADIHVINKADAPGAAAALAQVEDALAAAYIGEPGINAVTDALRGHAIQPPSPGRRALMRRHGDPERDPSFWRPPAHLVTATKATGIDALAASVDRFLSWCTANARLESRRRARMRAQLLRELGATLLAPYLAEEGAGVDAVAAWVELVLAGKTSPAEAARRIVRSAGE